MSAPCWDSPRRLWSLLEMLKFDAATFFNDLEQVNWVEAWLPEDTSDKDYERRYAEVLTDIQDVANQCNSIGLKECADEALRYLEYAKNHRDNPKGIHALGRVLHTSIHAQLEKRVFLWVRSDRGVLVDSTNAFGKASADAFPSAMPDVREAGNCLAADCGTGAVFHLMRAAEVALRALARDRRVTFPKGDIDTKQWGELLSKLSSEIAELVRRDSKLWPSEDVRQAQIRFYQEALIVFNAFNDVFRRHVSHAHDGAMYEVDRAVSVWNHTKRFMTDLAAKVSEHTVGDEYWKAV